MPGRRERREGAEGAGRRAERERAEVPPLPSPSAPSPRALSRFPPPGPAWCHGGCGPGPAARLALSPAHGSEACGQAVPGAALRAGGWRQKAAGGRPPLPFPSVANYLHCLPAQLGNGESIEECLKPSVAQGPAGSEARPNPAWD